MKGFEASTTIDAGQDAVWKVLTDVGAWPSWDSGVESVEGDANPGSRLVIHSSVAPGRAFPVKVTSAQPGELLEFTGGMPLGLFRGVRRYRLESDGEGTRFTMREEYTGALLGMIWKSIPDLGPSFEQFANGLKARVEADA
jgi:hypothetical protein